MHIGLIGGIGPAATDVYYRGLIKAASEADRDLELTIVHADTPTLLGNLVNDNKTAQCAIYERLTDRLQAAGADCVVVTSIAGHFCIDAFAEISPLPILDLTEAVSAWLKDTGYARVGVLGTAAVMASGLYGKLDLVTVLAPEGEALSRVHDAYVSLAQSGVPTPDQREVFFSEGKALMHRGAEAVLLGGTDLNVAFDGHDCGFPLVDCAGIHIEAVARHI